MLEYRSPQWPTNATSNVAKHATRARARFSKLRCTFLKMNDEIIHPEAIAIIGMAGRFPSDQSWGEFWQNFMGGEDFTIRDLEAGSILERQDLFDATFFGISANEAGMMDPQHRLFLECAWEALEDSGYDSHAYPGKVSVYASSRPSDYQKIALEDDTNPLPTLVSDKLNLRDAIVTIHASGAREAIYQAATALLTHQCTIAIAGAVSINFPQSPDSNDSVTSDEDSQYCGVILLKRLSAAIADRDPIRAVIKNWTEINDSILIQEPPPPPTTTPGRKIHLLTLSAKSPAALDAMAQRLADFIVKENPDLADVCYTLATGRYAFEYRRTIVASDAADAISKLRETGNSTIAPELPPLAAFLFPGQGLHYPEMGRAIYDSEEIFKAAVDECALLLRPLLQHDIRSTLYPSEHERESSKREFNNTGFIQACVFTSEYALAQLWISWGVKPGLLIGHGSGEYVAAVLTGSFKLEHALQLLANRTRLIQELPNGAMLEPILAAFIEDAAMIPANEPQIPWISTCTGKAMDLATLTEPGYWARQLRQPVLFAEALATAYQQENLALLEVGAGQALTSDALQHPSRSNAAVVSSISSSATELADVLNATGKLWENGVPLDWTAFYQNENRRRLHLPTYPFERKSYWIAGVAPPLGKGQAGFTQEIQPLTAMQQNELDQFIARYTTKSKSSKNHTAEHRFHYANPRAVFGFRSLWKEMIYPIISARSKDARIWDIDGNEYIDFTMGFGSCLFGHSPQWLTTDLEQHLRSSTEIGPQSQIGGRLAKTICEITEMERAAFYHTATEALATAMRLARTVTGRQRIVYIAERIPGNLQSSADDLVLLDCADPGSLESLRSLAHELAAVVVDPVRVHTLGLQQREFMQDVRDITEEFGTAFIVDEAITGFRITPGGAQAYFGIQADMASYGIPFGILAGKKEYLDALDGATWSYGDDSSPKKVVISHTDIGAIHPLALASALRVLEHLIEEGPGLQTEMQERVARVCHTLNDYLEKIGVSIKLSHFSGQILIEYAEELNYASLLWFFLREKGIYIWEDLPFSFSNAHTDEDLDLLIKAFVESIAAMQAAGFLPASVVETVTAPIVFPRYDQAPTTAAQHEIFRTVQLGDDANCTFNESHIIHLEGELNACALRSALNDIAARHPSLRSTFTKDGLSQNFHPSGKPIELVEHDFSGNFNLSAASLIPVSLIKNAETALPFDLINGPLIRLQLIHLPENRHELIFTAHHIVFDDRSFGVVLSELASAYNARIKGRLPRLISAMSCGDSVCSEQSHAVKERPLELPTAQPKSYQGGMETLELDPKIYADLKQKYPQLGDTFHATLLAAFATALHRITDQEELTIGVTFAAQTKCGPNEFIGHCLQIISLRLAPAKDMDIRSFSLKVAEQVAEALDQEIDPNFVPFASVKFSLDEFQIEQIRFDSLQLSVATNPKQFVNSDLSFKIKQSEERLVVECEFNKDLYSEATLDRLLGQFQSLLKEMVVAPVHPLSQHGTQS